MPTSKSDGHDVAIHERLPAPSPTVLVAAIHALIASRRSEIGPASMWRLMGENAIGADGYSVCIALAKLGLLEPSLVDSGIYNVHFALQDATLATRLSAKLWLEALVRYTQIPHDNREKLLDTIEGSQPKT